MARKHHKPEEIVAKLRQVEVLLAQGKTAAEAVRAIGVTEQTSRCFEVSPHEALVRPSRDPIRPQEGEEGLASAPR